MFGERSRPRNQICKVHNADYARVATVGRRQLARVQIKRFGAAADGAFWSAFLRSLRARGLAWVQLIISDAHGGLQATQSWVIDRNGCGA